MKRRDGKSPLFGKQYIIHDILKVTGGPPGLLWLRPKLIYESKAAKKRIRGGAVIISNHNGFGDPVLCMFAIWYRRQHFLCLEELYDHRPHWIFHNILTIPIDRENFGIASLRQISDELRAGSLVTVFPEGKINSDENMMSFKSGMVLMALQGHAPIIPIYIRKRKHFYSRLVCAIGERVDVAEMYGERPTFAEIEAVTALLREKEEHLRTLAGE